MNGCANRSRQPCWSTFVTTSVCKQLIELGVVVDVRARHVLFREGEANHDLYVLLRGRLDLSMIVPGSWTKSHSVAWSWRHRAWSSILGDWYDDLLGTRHEDSQLLAVPAKSLRKISEQYDRFGRELMKLRRYVLSKRLLATRLQLLDLFRHPNTLIDNVKIRHAISLLGKLSEIARSPSRTRL